MSHSGIEPQTPAQQQQRIDVENYSDASSVVDERTDDEKKTDKELADRLSVLIENANERLIPLVRMIRKVNFIAIYFHPYLVTCNAFTSI